MADLGMDRGRLVATVLFGGAALSVVGAGAAAITAFSTRSEARAPFVRRADGWTAALAPTSVTAGEPVDVDFTSSDRGAGTLSIAAELVAESGTRRSYATVLDGSEAEPSHDRRARLGHFVPERSETWTATATLREDEIAVQHAALVVRRGGFDGIPIVSVLTVLSTLLAIAGGLAVARTERPPEL